MALKENTEVIIEKDSKGNLIKSVEKISKSSIKKSDEAIFFKIYAIKETREILSKLSNGAYRLFFSLCFYLNYADINDLEGGMTFKLDTITQEEIMLENNFSRSSYFEYKKELENNKLIEKIKGNLYQVNPFVVGKGYYSYKPTYKSGGIENIQASWRKKAAGLDEKPSNTTIYTDCLIKAKDMEEQIKYLHKEIPKIRYGKGNYADWTSEQKQEEIREYENKISRLSVELKEINLETYVKITKYLPTGEENVPVDQDIKKSDDIENISPPEDFFSEGFNNEKKSLLIDEIQESVELQKDKKECDFEERFVNDFYGLLADYDKLSPVQQAEINIEMKELERDYNRQQLKEKGAKYIMEKDFYENLQKKKKKREMNDLLYGTYRANDEFSVPAYKEPEPFACEDDDPFSMDIPAYEYI